MFYSDVGVCIHEGCIFHPSCLCSTTQGALLTAVKIEIACLIVKQILSIISRAIVSLNLDRKDSHHSAQFNISYRNQFPTFVEFCELFNFWFTNPQVPSLSVVVRHQKTFVIFSLPKKHHQNQQGGNRPWQPHPNQTAYSISFRRGA